MPIIPRSAGEPHRHREMAESFGADAARYDRTRPTYPAALIEQILAASPGRDVLDVGVGTGISARLLQSAGCDVLGVEVDERMAAFARRAGSNVELGKFEDWDPAGRTFDAVVAGQAWHWVDPVAGAAKAARVLRPGGLFAVFWNVHQPEPAAAEAFGEIYARLVPEAPQFYRKDMAAERTFAPYREPTERGLRAANGAFSEPEVSLYDWDVRYTRDEWLDVVPTHGGHTLLPAARLAELLDELGSAIDTLGGSFAAHFTTVALTSTRFPSSPVRGEPNDPPAPNVPAATDRHRQHTPGN